MKFRFNSKYFRWGLTAFLVLAAAIAFYYFIFHSSDVKSGFGVIMDILAPVVFGLATAYLLAPVLNFLEDRMLVPLFGRCRRKETAGQKKLVRGIGILITAFLFAAFLCILASMFLSQIVPSVKEIIVNFDSYVNAVTDWINHLLEDNPDFDVYITQMTENFSGELKKWLNDLFPNIEALVKTVSLSFINFLNMLWDFAIGFVIAIYVLGSKERFAGQAKKMIYALFERDAANNIIKNFRFIHRTFIGFLGGKVVDSIIIGFLCFIGTSIMGTPYAALVSVIIACTNIIPFFGPFLGLIPSAVLIFAADPMHPQSCVYFVIFILVLQQFDGNVLGPKILGNSTGLSGFWIIFSITLFGGLFGVFGMIVGVPVFAVIYAAVRSAANAMLEKKNLTQKTEEYVDLDYIDEDGVHMIPEKSQKFGTGQKLHENHTGKN